MTPFFAIAPWEYPGAVFDPTPHAITRADIGGRERVIWLKMRDGVIYFRDAARVQTLAIPKLCDPQLSTDAKALIENWKREIEIGNYGVYAVTRRTWPGTLATSSFCIILCADGHGWIAEHFDNDWQKFEIALPQTLDLWRKSPFGEECAQVAKQMRARFLDRTVDEVDFRSLPQRWTGGKTEAMVDVLRSAALLWIVPEKLGKSANNPLEWRCKSNSLFYEGGVSSDLIWASSHRYNKIWEIVKRYYHFVGVEWRRASAFPELQSQYNDKVWQQGFEKWGENWRGNFVSEQYQMTLTAPPLSTPSHHDKLEAALILREFLADKMPAAKVEAMLHDALQNG